jgi:hypothetical protein
LDGHGPSTTLMEPDHPFFRVLDSSLGGAVPAEPVEVGAEWSSSVRRTYRSGTQLGTGTGPFVDVEDRRWSGTLRCQRSVGGMGFLLTESAVYWAKGPLVGLALPVEVSLHAYVSYAVDRATFSAGVAGAFLPGVPVAANPSLAETCAVRAEPFSTGRVVALAQTALVSFAAVLFPSSVLKMGRNHLWRVCDEVASLLPPDICTMLTRRRAGSFDTRKPWPTS